MADGEDLDENPFSFKSFVQKKAGSLDSEDETASGGIRESLPDIGISVNHGGARPRHLKIEETDESRKKEEADNPFSFKKFLQSGAGVGARPKTTNHANLNFDLANDLPDFVQDHLSSENKEQPVPHPDGPLPDFALDSRTINLAQLSSSSPIDETHHPLHDPLELLASDIVPIPSHPINNPPEIIPVAHGGARPKRSKRNDKGAKPSPKIQDNSKPVPNGDLSSPDIGFPNATKKTQSDVNDIDDDGGSFDVRATVNLPGLPDFLSGSAANGLKSLWSDGSPSGDITQPQPDSSLSIVQLQQKNQELRSQILEVMSQRKKDLMRISELEKELDIIKSRESEENSALENMVQQVEANLKITTKRASQAENAASKYKQDIKTLQTQVDYLEAELLTLRSGNDGRDVIREKTKYASEQLSLAAQSAESKIKELMLGVDQIKLMSHVLASIDKISDAAGPTLYEDVEGASGGVHGS